MNQKALRSQTPRPQFVAPLPPLKPHRRSQCGSGNECLDNQKWDSVFAKFEVKEDHWKTKGFYRSTLRGW
jgi:hypothetical protein